MISLRVSCSTSHWTNPYLPDRINSYDLWNYRMCEQRFTFVPLRTSSVLKCVQRHTKIAENLNRKKFSVDVPKSVQSDNIK